jgi:hypothetical protein
MMRKNQDCTRGGSGTYIKILRRVGRCIRGWLGRGEWVRVGEFLHSHPPIDPHPPADLHPLFCEFCRLIFDFVHHDLNHRWFRIS